MNTTHAWLLDFGNGIFAATGSSTVLHVIENAPLFKVPLAPAHCDRVLLWQGRVLPTVNMLALFGDPLDSRHEYPCIVGWRESENDSAYGALLLQAMPRRIAIGDNDIAEPASNDAARWREFALGFFSYSQRVVPILDVAPLFGSKQHAAAVTTRAHRIA